VLSRKNGGQQANAFLPQSLLGVLSSDDRLSPRYHLPLTEECSSKGLQLLYIIGATAGQLPRKLEQLFRESGY
jgi:hypothetical protein